MNIRFWTKAVEDNNPISSYSIYFILYNLLIPGFNQTHIYS